jgi:transposase
MRAAQPPMRYLVGTPRGRLSQYEKRLTERPWQVARQGVSVQLLAEGEELYVLAESKDRVNKERAMRRRQLKGLWKRLHALRKMKLQRDELLQKLGAARHEYPVGARLIQTGVAAGTAELSFTLRRDKLRQARRREGRYLLRSNITTGQSADPLWQFYIQLTEVEAAFKNLKDDLALRPIHHQLEHRIEAHIFISFLAYCLHVTLRRRLRELAPGLTARAVLEKFGPCKCSMCICPRPTNAR